MVIPRAEGGSDPDLNEPPEPRSSRTGGFTSQQRIDNVGRILQELRVNKPVAQQLLKVWKKAGVTDGSELKKYLKDVGAKRSVAASIQLFLNGSAATVAWWTASQIAETPTKGSFALAGELAAYFTAIYLTSGAIVELLNVFAVGIATRKYSANADAFLEAIESIAGSDSGLAVLDKARQAVVSLQVLNALDSLLTRLKEDASAARSDDFFRDLGAYLVLTQAAKNGCDPLALGVSADEAAAAAAEFALADSNDDGRIDLVEFRRLAPSLSEDEALGAMSVLDVNKNGSIEFKEWLQWWVKQREGEPNHETHA
jgi:hypothetical protein